MVDKGNTDKHRTGITGNGLKGLSKVVETSKWGESTARQRNGIYHLRGRAAGPGGALRLDLTLRPRANR